MKTNPAIAAVVAAMISVAMTLTTSAQTQVTIDATDGAATVSTNYTTDGGLTVGMGFFAEYLIVGGGGGGGGGFNGGGGGAGGFLTGTTGVTNNSTAVTVGGGGGGAIQNVRFGQNGGNSSFAGITAIGGGRGAHSPASGAYGALPGGSGGGGAHSNDSGTQPGGSGTPGQGNAGGNGLNGTLVGAGGGGAGAAGANVVVGGVPTDGGAGLSSDITGTLEWYAGGGGGGNRNVNQTNAVGGIGGGGAGGNNANGVNGTANTGGGGGGSGGAENRVGGDGGSGVVILRYAGDATGITGGSTDTESVPGFSVTRFNSSGTFGVNLNSRLNATLTTALGGSGNFTYNGPGTFALAADSTYLGATIVNAGTLQVGNGGTTGSLGSGNVTNNGTLAFNRSDELAVANAISGSGGLRQNGSGTAVLLGSNTYTGGTTISSGTLQIGDGGTTGSLGSGNVTNNATLAFNRSDNPTVANAISGSGALVQAGSGTTTFSGAHTHTGGTFVEAGTLALSGGSGSQGSTAVGPYTIGDGGTLRVTASTFWFNGTPSFNFTTDGGGTIDTSSGVNFVMGGNATLTSAGGARNEITGSSGINIGSRTATLDVARGTDATSDLHITSNFWNNGSIVKTGDGIATLAGNNSYSGTTTISAGTLQVGDGGTTGNLGNSTSIINNAALVFNRSDSVTQGNPISGSGSVTKIGAGTVTLSGNNSYTGLTTVNEGTLQLGAGGGAYEQNASDFAINNGSTLAFGGGAYHLNNASTGSPRTITFGAEGGNTLDTKGVNVVDWKGSTYQSQGGSRNAILGEGLNLNAGVVATFDVARGTDPDVDLAVSRVWNAGSIVKNGDGIMTLASAAYSGSTTVNAGTLSIAGGSDSSGSTVSGPVTIGDGATLRVTASTFWFNGTPTFNFTADGGGTIDTTSDVNFVMGGNATYTTAGGARNEITGSSGINLNSRTATLDVARGTDATTDLLLSTGLVNSGSLVKTGDGIATLSGSNNYTGTTTISAGTLQVGNGGTSGNLGTGNVVNNAALAFNRSDSHSVSNAISGTGSLTKNGTGTTTLAGNNTYSGGTAVNAGELNVNGSIAGSAVTVNSGASLSGSGAVGAISGSGAINPGNSPGILTAPSVDASGGLAFNFEFTSLNPTYSNASASLNDVLRLTDATPFVASLTSANTVNIFFDVDVFEEGQFYTGGFFTDTQADFLSQIVDASFNYYVQDAGGSVSHGGQSYTALGEGLAIDLATINQSADFAGGTIDGQVVQFEVVPEPSTYALLVLGAAALGAHAWRKRRRAQGL